MAATLKKSLAFAIGNVVAGALQSAKDTKSQDIAKKESDFQAVVADGSLSYADQLAYRKKQLAEEQASSMPDETWVESLTKSIGQINKLNRFAKYRATYQNSLASLKAGTETAQQHLSILQSQLGMTTDSDLQTEIQGEITDAQGFVKQSMDAILTNEVTRATKDGTIPVLSQAVADVSSRRAQAQLNGNDEAVSAYDVTLTNLKSQLSTANIQDATNKLTIQGLTKGMNAQDKLAALASEVGGADASSPITIGNVNYPSAKDYWNTVLGSYLSGTGSGLFQNFFTEMSNTVTNKINTAVASTGVTGITLDSINSTFQQLRSNPALTPYLNQLGDLQTQSLGSAMQYVAKTIIDRANYNQDFKSADTALTALGQQYGVDVSSYRLDLADKINAQALQATGGDTSQAAALVKKTGVAGITTPQSEFPVNPQADLSQKFGLSGQTVYDKTTNQPVTEDQFKAATGMQNLDWSKIKLDTGYKPPVAPTPATPATPAVPSAQPAPTAQPGLQMPTATPAAEPVAPVAPAPAAPAAPVAPTVASKYQGSSIIDYLKQNGQDTSFTSRKTLAEKNGIQNYVGSAEQNVKLLQTLNV